MSRTRVRTLLLGALLLAYAAVVFRVPARGAASKFDPLDRRPHRAVTLDPRDPARWADLADAYTRAGRPQAAVEALRRAAALDPDNPALQNWKANVNGATQ